METTKHTPEPWDLGPKTVNTLTCRHIFADSKNITNMYAYEFYNIGIDEVNANAERIVACVNACAGLSDEDVKRLPALLDEGTAAMQQRDELMAAAQKAMNECVDLIGTDAGNALEAAISKAKGLTNE